MFLLKRVSRSHEISCFKDNRYFLADRIESLSDETAILLNLTKVWAGECTMEALREKVPKWQVVPGEEFRKALFPWFEPSTFPEKMAQLARLMKKPELEKRIRDFGAR